MCEVPQQVIESAKALAVLVGRLDLGVEGVEKYFESNLTNPKFVEALNNPEAHVLQHLIDITTGSTPEQAAQILLGALSGPRLG